MRRAVVPEIVVILRVEGGARAYLLCSSYEDERRLAFELDRRDLLGEVIDALLRLATELEAAA